MGWTSIGRIGFGRVNWKDWIRKGRSEELDSEGLDPEGSIGRVESGWVGRRLEGLDVNGIRTLLMEGTLLLSVRIDVVVE